MSAASLLIVLCMYVLESLTTLLQHYDLYSLRLPALPFGTEIRSLRQPQSLCGESTFGSSPKVVLFYAVYAGSQKSHVDVVCMVTGATWVNG